MYSNIHTHTYIYIFVRAWHVNFEFLEGNFSTTGSPDRYFSIWITPAWISIAWRQDSWGRAPNERGPMFVALASATNKEIWHFRCIYLEACFCLSPWMTFDLPYHFQVLQCCCNIGMTWVNRSSPTPRIHRIVGQWIAVDIATTNGLNSDPMSWVTNSDV